MLIIPPRSASTVGCASRNARLKRSSPTQKLDLSIGSSYAEYAPLWPNFTTKREPPVDADDWKGKPDKLGQFHRARVRRLGVSEL